MVWNGAVRNVSRAGTVTVFVQQVAIVHLLTAIHCTVLYRQHVDVRRLLFWHTLLPKTEKCWPLRLPYSVCLCLRLRHFNVWTS